MLMDTTVIIIKKINGGSIMKVTTDERNKLILENMGLVIKIAKKYKPGFLEFDDFISAGVFGLVKGIERYDKNKGALSTILYTYIKQAISLEIANKEHTIRIPKSVKQNKNYDEAYEANTVNMVRLDQTLKNRSSVGGMSISLSDVIPDPSVDIENQVVKTVWGDSFRHLLYDVLLPNEFDIIDAFFIQGIAEYTIADRLGMCQSNVNSIKQRGIRKIREHIKNLSFEVA